MVEIKAAPVETVPAKVYECLTCTITKVIESKVIEIESFVDIADVNPIYYETSYYAEPDTKNNKAYALLVEALVKSKKVQQVTSTAVM